MSGTLYKPDEATYLRSLVAQSTDSTPSEIARRFRERYPERTFNSVRCKIKDIRSEPPAKDESVEVQEWAAKREIAIAEVEKQPPAFEIIELPPLPVPKLRYTPNPCYVVSSDHHWPLHDERVEAIILQAIEVLRPRGYILNGDGPDMLALSKYPKDARRGKSWELREEQRAAKSWWWQVGRLMAQWDGAIYETEANHSGNGRESRWQRYLSENCSHLFGLDGFEEINSYQRYFHPPDVPVQMVEEHVIAGDLRVRHGEIVRKHGGYSARAHGDKWQASILHGHTHRIGSSMKRRPGIPGGRGDEYIRTFETGCACLLDADYCPGSDWQNGFAIVHVDDASGSYGVELVHVINGRATSTALRGTLAA